MPKFNRTAFRCFCCLLLCCRLFSAHADTNFETTRAKPAAVNPPGVTLTLALTGGKTVFHRGEIIPLSAVFVGATPGVYDLNTDPGNRNRIWSSDMFRCDSLAAADPLRVSYDHEFGQVFEEAGPRFGSLMAKPVSITFTLNEWLRFDTPGRYRVFLTSRRVVDTAKRHDALMFQGHAVTSNAVEFTVLPDDPAWDAETLKSALPLYDRVSNDYQTQVYVSAVVSGAGDKAGPVPLWDTVQAVPKQFCRCRGTSRCAPPAGAVSQKARDAPHGRTVPGTLIGPPR